VASHQSSASRRAGAAATTCSFCAVAAQEAPARIVHEGPRALAFFPDFPAVRGHTLVIPRTHVPDFLEAGVDTSAAVAVACRDVGRALQAVLEPQGMNAVTSRGRAATQSIFHWHVHLLPRWEGDALGDLWPPDRPTPASDLDALAGSLRHALT
jgi:histidine triad (HIT) family protein